MMVLPERIELSTSPLPRGCSTTELRQRLGGVRRYTRPRRLTRKAGRLSLHAAMTDTTGTPHLTPARRAERAARDKRLAAALRANLQRRKEQARARTDDETPASARKPETGQR
jgi:hypothetical protein